MMDSISSMFTDKYLISVKINILKSEIVEHLYKMCDAVTGEECLQLIPGLSRGFVDFFLISKLQPTHTHTAHTTVFLEQASPVKKCYSDYAFFKTNFQGLRDQDISYKY